MDLMVSISFYSFLIIFLLRGIGYTVARIPIASCDFSTREYSYVEREGDFQLESFTLLPEDQQKIKWTKRAKELVKEDGENIKVDLFPFNHLSLIYPLSISGIRISMVCSCLDED